jgi:hypothetical protein
MTVFAFSVYCTDGQTSVCVAVLACLSGAWVRFNRIFCLLATTSHCTIITPQKMASVMRDNVVVVVVIVVDHALAQQSQNGGVKKSIVHVVATTDSQGFLCFSFSDQ